MGKRNRGNNVPNFVTFRKNFVKASEFLLVSRRNEMYLDVAAGEERMIQESQKLAQWRRKQKKLYETSYENFVKGRNVTLNVLYMCVCIYIYIYFSVFRREVCSDMQMSAALLLQRIRKLLVIVSATKTC